VYALSLTFIFLILKKIDIKYAGSMVNGKID
jgi:hypothetical protein